MPQIVLHEFPGGAGVPSVSPPCTKVELALRLARAEFEVRRVRSRGEARRVSRTGRLPVLEIDGERIADSNLILDRLETLFPEAGLAPDDPQQRVVDRLWEHFATDAIYWTGFALRWVNPPTREIFLDALFGRASWLTRRMVRLFFVPAQRRRAESHGAGLKDAGTLLGEVDRALAMAETGLAGGPFLQGRDRPARGDLALASLHVQAGFRGRREPLLERLERRPALVEHLRRTLAACGIDGPAWLTPTSTP
ncbi:MAG: hypothetical protein Kow0062_25030 [Acidobacteriota bacterium]